MLWVFHAVFWQVCPWRFLQAPLSALCQYTLSGPAPPYQKKQCMEFLRIVLSGKLPVPCSNFPVLDIIRRKQPPFIGAEYNMQLIDLRQNSYAAAVL